MNDFDDLYDRRDLRQKLSKSFSEDDLRSLCFDFAIQFEDLKGETKKGKVVALIEYFERHDQFQNLQTYVERVLRERVYRLNPHLKVTHNERLFEEAKQLLYEGFRDQAIKKFAQLASNDPEHTNLTVYL